MLNQAMEAGLNEQITHEFASAYAYLAMAAHCEQLNFAGIAHWLQNQAQEELAHAMRFYTFVHDRGGKVLLQAVPQPQTEYASVVDVFEHVLQHEQRITTHIHNLYALAQQEKDYASIPFLQSFIVEQTEEEKTASEVLARVRMAGGEARALLVIDHQMAQRGPGSEHA